MSLAEVAAHYQEAARIFSNQPPLSHAERVRRSLRSLTGVDPTPEEVEKAVASARSLRQMEFRSSPSLAS